jgi:drug/metabolite transporter superfamily protein YnfA
MNARPMNAALTSLLLLLAACLEVGGDALVRLGLKNYTGTAQLAFIAIGGVVLLGYGIFVNIAPADFGRLLGIYVVLFFIVAQVTNLLVFGIRPGAPILTGGTLIVIGGLIITLWNK